MDVFIIKISRNTDRVGDGKFPGNKSGDGEPREKFEE